MSFEIKHKDGLGRIGILETQSGVIETPCLFPVINPIRQTIPSNELKRTGASAVITNAFLIHSNEGTRHKALEHGVHDLIGWKGPVMTDSGAFQLMQYGDIEITNEGIVEFQSAIGTDIGLILDIPVAKGSRDDFEKAVLETINRARQFEGLEKSEKILWVGPIQGGPHIDLIRDSSQALGALSFDLHALGSVVPLLEEYAFQKVVDMILAAKKELPINRPLHLFGAGHPMFFSFSVLLGCDLFDSAAYALFARKERYLTSYGTYLLENLEYFPCSCPICSKLDPHDVREMGRDEKESALALHNLFVSFQELKIIKQSIREGTLWRLVSERVAAHPNLVDAWMRVFEPAHLEFIETLEVLSKKRALFITREEMMQHPLVIRHHQRVLNNLYTWGDTLLLTRVMPKPTSSLEWQIGLVSDVFGVIPLEIRAKYPLLQYETYNVSVNQETFLRDFLKQHRSSFRQVLIHPSVETADSLVDDYDCELIADLEVPTMNDEQHDEYVVRAFLAYQFGLGAETAVNSPKIRRSKRTGRIGWIYDGNTPMAAVRASDFMLIPTIELARVLHNHLPAPNMRVMVDSISEPFVREGKSVFAKFVKNVWAGIRSGDEILVVNESDDLIGAGTALLAPLEMLQFKRGTAVKTRAGIPKAG